jgi:hypothetical protein
VDTSTGSRIATSSPASSIATPGDISMLGQGISRLILIGDERSLARLLRRAEIYDGFY